MKQDRAEVSDYLSLEEFFNNLLHLLNSAGNGHPEGQSVIYAKDGHQIISSYVGAKLKCRRQTVKRNVDELARLGYVEKLYLNRNCHGIRFLRMEWDQNRAGAAKAPSSQPPRTFALFMDYRNLEMGIPDSFRRFRDFSWLVNPILAHGKIVFAFVFIPDHYGGRVPLHQLANKHSFIPILCTRRISRINTQDGDATKDTTKDGDTVDAKMDALARSLIVHADVTDIVIISGDADFQDLINFARYHQKGVTVVSAAQATSGRLFEMAQAGAIQLALH